SFSPTATATPRACRTKGTSKRRPPSTTAATGGSGAGKRGAGWGGRAARGSAGRAGAARPRSRVAHLPQLPRRRPLQADADVLVGAPHGVPVAVHTARSPAHVGDA